MPWTLAEYFHWNEKRWQHRSTRRLIFTQTVKRWSWTNRANSKACSVPPVNINFFISPVTGWRNSRTCCQWLNWSQWKVEKGNNSLENVKNSTIDLRFLCFTAAFLIYKRGTLFKVCWQTMCKYIPVTNLCAAFRVLPSATTLHYKSHDTRFK